MENDLFDFIIIFFLLIVFTITIKVIYAFYLLYKEEKYKKLNKKWKKLE